VDVASVLIELIFLLGMDLLCFMNYFLLLMSYLADRVSYSPGCTDYHLSRLQLHSCSPAHLCLYFHLCFYCVFFISIFCTLCTIL